MGSVLDRDHWTGEANVLERIAEMERRIEGLERSAMAGLFDEDGIFEFPGKLAVVPLGVPVSLTIEGGEITANYSYHKVDTEGAAGTDDLDTINGGTHGDLLILQAMDSARTVVAKDGTGNLLLAGDFSLDSTHDLLLLMRGSANWIELSRSDNG